MTVDDEFSERIAELLHLIEELPPDRREQLQRELDEISRESDSAQCNKIEKSSDRSSKQENGDS